MNPTLRVRSCSLAWLSLALLTAPPVHAAATCAIRDTCQAESGTLLGTTRSTSRAGFSGTGYVAGFDLAADSVVFQVESPTTGLHDLEIGYASPFGDKGYGLRVGDVAGSGTFPSTKTWSVRRHGRVPLVAGSNRIALGGGWSWYEIDWIRLVPATPAALAKPPRTPSDPAATPGARAVLNWLIDQYGKATVAGQQEISELPAIRAAGGDVPVILGGDLMDYSPSRRERGTNPRHVETYLDSARRGYLVQWTWHWNAPTDLVDNPSQPDGNGGTRNAAWYKGFMAYATTFDLPGALADTSSAGYRLLLRDIDSIAVQLAKFDRAGIPVLWRPLHEAEGQWFWWGAHGSGTFRKLWSLLRHRLVVHHKLHNLLWVYTSEGKPGWYPGDSLVDIVGADVYPSDPLDLTIGTWQTLLDLHGGAKMLALTEFGGAPDIRRMQEYGVWWSFFLPWTGPYGVAKNPATVPSAFTGAGVLSRHEVDFLALYASPVSVTPLRGRAPSPRSGGPRVDLSGRRWSTEGGLGSIQWSIIPGEGRGSLAPASDPRP